MERITERRSTIGSGTSLATFLALLTCACGARIDARAFGMPSMPGDTGETTAGELRLLTYNVAGLLDPISGSQPSVNHPLISPKLNDHELVLMQEDFFYHQALAQEAEHPFQSQPDEAWQPWRPGDGLNRFSRYAPADHVRAAWTDCNGVLDQANDCLTDKGYSVSFTELAQGIYVDVYNLHMDAGGDAGDISARAAQIDQLLDVIAGRSANRSLIVAGDTNLAAHREADQRNLQRLLDGAGLVDACAALECGDDRIDRVLLRSSTQLEFEDSLGAPLSDHDPIAVRLAWRWR